MKISWRLMLFQSKDAGTSFNCLTFCLNVFYGLLLSSPSKSFVGEDMLSVKQHITMKQARHTGYNSGQTSRPICHLLSCLNSPASPSISLITWRMCNIFQKPQIHLPSRLHLSIAMSIPLPVLSDEPNDLINYNNSLSTCLD